MRKTLSRIMGILLATTLLVGVLPVMPTTASLEVPSMEDVIIAQANTPYKAFFPDVVLIPQDKLPSAEQADYPNGKLLVAYYQNEGHVAAENTKEAMGTIQMVESKDNGRTWSDSRMVLNAEMLMEYGIGHENYPMEPRDPNFAILSDGTVIFTFFVRNMNTDSTTQAYITYSCDGGKTFAAPTLIPTALLDAWYAKRGDIAVFSDDQMLVPIYGQGSAVSGQAGVNILCTLQADGTFRFEGEYLLADSGSLGGTINEVSLVATEDDTVYAMAREMGYVWKSTDHGVSWECIGKETVIGGTQMHQPGLKLLDDGSIFATWTVCNTSATGSRPVYAKRFFPELGWDATDAKLVYRYDGPSNDTGDPSSCVLPNGDVLVLYYVTADATVKGTFVQPDEMLEADAFPLEASERGQAYTYLVENYDALSLGQFTHSKFELITPSRITVAEDESGRFMRFAGNKPSAYNWGQVYSYDKLAGDYTATFDFRFSGATASGETEEAYVTLLHLGGVTAMCHIRQNEILYKIDSASVTAQKDKNFTPGEWYSLRISRAGDGLYVRAWKKGTPEPAEWDLEQHHNVVKTTTGAFRLAYLSSNPTDKYFDVDNLVLSRRSVGELNTHTLTATKGEAARQLSVTFTPDLTKATPSMTPSVVWTSTDASVATVDNGNVSFVGAGTATVTASTALGEVIDSCTVTVVPKPQLPNTAVVNDRIITVKAEEGYQLKAGSLIVTDANGVRYVPTRVGYRDGGDGSKYEVPAEAAAPYTVDYAFVQPTGNTGEKDNNINVAYLGAQTTDVNTYGGGMRHIHRLNISTEGGKMYILYNGEKQEVKEYGLLLAAQAVLKNPEDLDIETAKDSMHVKQYVWPETNKYFDHCSDYVDLSVHVTGIVTVGGGDVNIITRTYVKLANGTVYYGKVAVDSYNAVNAR